MQTPGSPHRTLAVPILVFPLLVFLIAGTPQSAAAQIEVEAATDSELVSAILAANAEAFGVATTITLTDDITLSQSLPMISSYITFVGNGFLIDADDTGRVFFVQAGVVNISDVTIANALAVGGSGGTGTIMDQPDEAGSPGGGGGLGAGAALFVNTGASVTVSNVTIVNAQAVGGAAVPAEQFEPEVIGDVSGTGAGGGGIGGQGGSAGAGDTSNVGGGGGGGGYQGTGGGTDGFSGGGGGGGGQLGSGGYSFSTGGGGGGGASIDGQDNSTGFPTPGGGDEGGIGAEAGTQGGDAQGVGGGGGGGGLGGMGGAGDVGGGGGGGGAGADGGAGGQFGGGGGGGAGGSGGTGGFGAGGGSSGFVDTAIVGQGGAGGFGGGGGGGATGGAGGEFGGQGGSGMSADGGGGAALGGAVFVRSGGVLIITDGAFSGIFGVAGGTTGGAGGATPGQAQGALAFVMGAAGGTSAGSVTLAVSQGALTINEDDALAGAGALVKAGNGLLVLGGANTNFAGTFDITGGTLTFDVGGSLSAQTAVSVVSGTFDLNNTTQTIGSLAGGGSVQLGTGGLTTGALNTSTAFTGVMSGAGALTKLGTGTMTLGGANTYTGPTTVAAGTLQFVSGGSLSGQTAVNVLSGATFDLNGTTQIIGSLEGGGNVLLGNGALAAGGNNASTLFSGLISGAGSFAKVGTGTMTLSGAHTYTGATTVAAGTLRLDLGGSLPAATAVSVLSGATLDLNSTTQIVGSLAGAGSVVMGAGSLTAGGNNTSTLFSGTMSGPGSFVKTGTGTMTLGGANTYTGATTVAAGTLRFDLGGSLSGATPVSVLSGATLDLNDTTQTIASLAGGGNVLMGAGSLTVGTNNTSTTFTGVLSGSGGFNKVGAGVLTLGGVNTFTGPTTISAGTLRFDLGGGLPSATAVGLQLAGGSLSNLTTVAVASGATWDLNGAVQAVEGLAGHGEVWLGGGTLTVGGNGTSSAFGGALSGQGSLVKAGAGMLALTGINSHTGGTFLQGGTLLVGSDASLGASESGLFFDGGTLLLGGNLTSSRSLSLTSDGGIDTNGFQVRWDGLVSGPGTLTKAGSGVLALTNDNSYTGGTRIMQGTLIGTASSLRGDIFNEALLNFDQSVDGQYSGIISGTGALLKSGGGQLTLTGANSYTGGTAIAGGTLAGTSASLRGDILNDARLVFDQAVDGTFQGTLFGTGTTIKTGVGSLSLTGAHPFSGSTLVSQGTLALDGVLGGNVNVASGATFVGSGAILGSMNLSGRLQVPAADAALFSTSHTSADHPGHTPAQESFGPGLIIGGALTTNPGSVIQLNLSPGSTLPIGVEGGTFLNNTNFELGFSDVAGRSTTYTALTALGGLSANGITATSLNPDLVPVLTENGPSILVTLLNFGVPLAGAATSSNTASVGGALDAIKHGATGDLGQVVRELTALDDAGLDLALEGLAGQIHASQQWMAVLDSETFTDMIRQEITLRDHAYDDDLANQSYAPRAQQMRWWAQVAGERATFDGVGFRGAVANLGGVGGGFDVKRTDRWLFGLGGSYSAAGLSLDGLGAGSDLKAPRAFAYSGVRLGRVRLHAGGSSARTSYQTDRRITFAATVPAPGGGTVMLEEGVDREAMSEQVGWAHDAWSEYQDSIKIRTWTLDSKVGWRHVRFTRESWVERGAGAISLEAPEQTLKLTEADGTVHFFKRTGGIRPRMLFTYKRELFEEGSDVALQFVDQPEGRFSTSGLPTGKNTITALGGLTFMTESGLEYAIRYEVRHATGELRQKLAFRVRFR